MASKETAQKFVNEWLALDRDPVTRNEIEEKFKNGHYEELVAILDGRMVFGTAGLRGPIKAGFLCMNELTITQTAQGFYKYLEKTFPDLKEKGIAIAYDMRNYSINFAEITAATFLVHGVPVYMYSRVAPTPYAPFAGTFFNCRASVMVTASHNPSTDNGYKVYWDDGVQITEPHDAGIQEEIERNQKPWPETKDRQAILANGRIKGLLVDPFACGIEKAYHEAIQPVQFRTSEKNATTSVKFAYSAMWGVGYEAAMKALLTFGFDIEKSFVSIGREFLPDPFFGGVRVPNPEEKHNMLRVAEAAEKHGCSVCLANDPDADRLGVAERNPDGSWRVFHGNEIGILLADWISSRWPLRHKQLTGEDVAPNQLTLVNSTVSSKMLKALSEDIGAEYFEVLTGFKWIGRVCREEERRGRYAIYGFEEAIGFMCGEPVRDKDGISVICCMAELVSELYEHGKTLWGRYCEISERLGWFRVNNGNIAVSDNSLVEKIFKNLRTCGHSHLGAYASEFGRFKVKHVRDLTLPGFDSEMPDKRPVLPLSAAQMITFKFEGGAVMTLRTSGTEPKVKWYVEVQDVDATSAQAQADELAEALRVTYLAPFQ